MIFIWKEANVGERKEGNQLATVFDTIIARVRVDQTKRIWLALVRRGRVPNQIMRFNTVFSHQKKKKIKIFQTVLHIRNTLGPTYGQRNNLLLCCLGHKHACTRYRRRYFIAHRKRLLHENRRRASVVSW